MRFPFPSFKDWLQAFLLLSLMAAWFFLATVIIFGLIGLGALMNNDYVVLLSFPVALIVFPICFFTYIHYLLRGERNPNRPAWLATYDSWNEGVWRWFIASTATIIVLTIMVVSTWSLLETMGGLDDPDIGRAVLRSLEKNQFLNNALVALWIAIMAWMFRWKRLWDKKIASKRKMKATVPPTAPPNSRPMTIDDELDRLRVQMEEDKKEP
jgi:hypothetical protein